MNRPLVSIVVPMYNTSRYLDQCIKSLQQQTLRQIEIVLVDDGSPDDCLAKAEKYKESDSRIKVIHRSNGGLGAARNSGIEASQGTYIAFVDSDDWIDSDMMLKMYAAAAEVDADVCLSGMRTVDDGRDSAVFPNPYAGRIFEGDNVFLLRREYYGASPCQKGTLLPVSVCTSIYKTLFIKENNLRFTTMKSEDALFNIEAFKLVQRAVCVDGMPYCYRKDGQPSITNTFDIKMLDLFEERFRLQQQLAREECMNYRGECMLRTQKWGLDIARILISRIGRMSKSDSIYLARRVCRMPFVRDSLDNFPATQLPWKQRVFFHAVKNSNIRLALALTCLHRVS